MIFRTVWVKEPPSFRQYLQQSHACYVAARVVWRVWACSSCSKDLPPVDIDNTHTRSVVCRLVFLALLPIHPSRERSQQSVYPTLIIAFHKMLELLLPLPLPLFFFFYPPADAKKKSFSSPHFHVFSYASSVDLTHSVAFAAQR